MNDENLLIQYYCMTYAMLKNPPSHFSEADISATVTLQAYVKDRLQIEIDEKEKHLKLV